MVGMLVMFDAIELVFAGLAPAFGITAYRLSFGLEDMGFPLLKPLSLVSSLSVLALNACVFETHGGPFID